MADLRVLDPSSFHALRFKLAGKLPIGAASGIGIRFSAALYSATTGPGDYLARAKDRFGIAQITKQVEWGLG